MDRSPGTSSPPKPAAVPLFLVGAGRCGTTRLFRALSAHPRIGLTDEARVADLLHFAAHLAALPDHRVELFPFEEPARLRGVVTAGHVEEFAPLFEARALELLREYYERHFAGRDLAYFGDKLPHPLAAQWVLERIPGTRIVVLVRDPRDWICSARAYAARSDMREHYPHLDVSLEERITHWRNVYCAAIDRRDTHALIRYEDLIADTGEVVRALLETLGLDHHPGCLDPRTWSAGAADHGTSSPGSSVGRWRSELSRSEARAVEDACAETMRALGYPLGIGVSP